MRVQTDSLNSTIRTNRYNGIKKVIKNRQTKKGMGYLLRVDARCTVMSEGKIKSQQNFEITWLCDHFDNYSSTIFGRWKYLYIHLNIFKSFFGVPETLKRKDLTFSQSNIPFWGGELKMFLVPFHRIWCLPMWNCIVS